MKKGGGERERRGIYRIVDERKTTWLTSLGAPDNVDLGDFTVGSEGFSKLLGCY